MDFTELGFSLVNVNYETETFDKLLKVQLNGAITKPQLLTIPWDSYFMTDRQCAKKILLKREPELTDDDVNKMVYGTDLKRKQGASYVPFVTDDDVIDPSIVSTDESMTDTLDSPFKPLKPTIELYEQIYQWKKQIKVDFMIIETSLRDFKEDREHMKYLIDKASSFINTSALTQKPTTTPLPAANLTSFNTAPLVVNIASLFSIVMEALKITRDNKRKISQITQNFMSMPYLDFLVKPERLESSYQFATLFSVTLFKEKEFYNQIEDVIKNKQKLIEDAQTEIQNLDSQLEDTTINQFITPTTGTIPAEIAYETLRQQLELDKESLLRDLVDDLKIAANELILFTS